MEQKISFGKKAKVARAIIINDEKCTSIICFLIFVATCLFSFWVNGNDSKEQTGTKYNILVIAVNLGYSVVAGYIFHVIYDVYNKVSEIIRNNMQIMKVTKVMSDNLKNHIEEYVVQLDKVDSRRSNVSPNNVDMIISSMYYGFTGEDISKLKPIELDPFTTDDCEKLTKLAMTQNVLTNINDIISSNISLFFTALDTDDCKDILEIKQKIEVYVGPRYVNNILNDAKKFLTDLSKTERTEDFTTPNYIVNKNELKKLITIIAESYCKISSINKKYTI